MKTSELGRVLKEMYKSAPEGEAVTMIHLFGIKYAEIIISSEFTAREIVTEAGLNDSYATEVRKGIKISRYVKLKS